jgi:hypothetical protein
LRGSLIILSSKNEKAHLGAGRLQLDWKIETQTRLLDRRVTVVRMAVNVQEHQNAV